MLSLLLWSVVSILTFMTIFYTISRLVGKISVIDIGWGLGFVLVAALNLWLAETVTIRGIILTVLVSGWGLRLAAHIYRRNRGQPEDRRYKKMKQNWGESAWWKSFTNVFLLQAGLLLSIAYPLLLVHAHPQTGLKITDYVGIGIWVIGFFFEVVGDYQLDRFIREEKEYSGQVMTKGLWKYTRHPNYFGEALLWWGVFLMAVSVPYGWLGFFSPLVIDYLLLKVSGVPLVEERYAGNEEFQAYAERTNKIIPWFPEED